MQPAASKIGTKYQCAVLCKGGHSINDANDLLYTEGAFHWIYGKRIANPNTHGTGYFLLEYEPRFPSVARLRSVIFSSLTFLNLSIISSKDIGPSFFSDG